MICIGSKAPATRVFFPGVISIATVSPSFFLFWINFEISLPAFMKSPYSMLYSISDRCSDLIRGVIPKLFEIIFSPVVVVLVLLFRVSVFLPSVKRIISSG